ncbi:MAG TPA: hypothetical protein VK601_30180, partial [Kofleriaceae bacterium]|nr:hypothetical protein [Kofleriaceae bacterium]
EIGAALAIGNFDGTGGADLAIGAPGGGLFGVAAGFVIVATGFGPGATEQYRTLSQVGLSVERAGERFGASLAAASLKLVKLSSLIVGAPETGVGWFGGSGRAYAFDGGAGGMTPVQELAPATTTVNAFGSAVAVAYTSTGPAIAVGSPGEDGARGRVHVFRTGGWMSPFPLALAQTLAHPTSTAVAGDRLGEVLAAVRVSGNTSDTLVAGLPRRDAPGATDSGAYIRFGSTAAGSSVPLVAQGTLVDNPSPGTGRRFGSSVATAGAYDATRGTLIERRVAIGSDGGEGGAGSFRVRDDASGWDLFHQETAHPE